MSKEEEVVCIDNLFSGKKFNVKKWENHPKFSFIEHDITNPISLNVDRIWHFSCPASSLFYKKDPLKTLNVCFNGTLNLDNSSILESQPVGTFIGIVAAEYSDDTDDLIYTIEGGDVHVFDLDAETGYLVSNVVFDYDIASTYTIT